MKKRTFSSEEKLRILQEVSVQGLNVTLSKYGIYPATYYSWKSKFTQTGEEGLEHGVTQEHIKRIRQLEKENQTLKTLLAEKELEGRLQEELLKKKYALERKKEILKVYISLGLSRERALKIGCISKHQYYYESQNHAKKKSVFKFTKKMENKVMSICTNKEVVF